MQVGGCSCIVYGLVFQPHGLLNSRQLALGNQLGTLLNGFRERFFCNQNVDNPASERFRRLLQSLQRYASTDLGFFKFDDPGLGYLQSTRELRLGHPQRISDGAQPALGGART